MNKPEPAPTNEGRPMSADDQRRWRERFFNQRWPSSFDRGRAPDGDDCDDCC